ncbi:ATP-binding SpoIIE family protein phosphatase [Streptomyces sp. NPDC003832]
MGIDVDSLLREGALRLRPRRDEMADRLVARLREEVPAVRAHEDLAEFAAEAVRGHLGTMLDALERGLDADDLDAPAAAVDFAVRLAERGGQITDLLRAYRLDHATLLLLLREEVARCTEDMDLANAVIGAQLESSFEYVHRISERAVAAFQEARDRRLQRRLRVVNEAGHRIGTSLEIASTAQELAEVGAEHLADFVTVDLLDTVLNDEEPAPVRDSLRLRRIAQQSVLAGCPESVVPIRSPHSYPQGSGPAEAILTGQLARYRIMADDIPPWIVLSEAFQRTVDTFGIHSAMVIPLWARGSPMGVVQFFRHRDPTPFDDDDLLLAHEVSSNAAVHIDSARQYTRQRATALALQRNLLPGRIPRHDALETAARYLPSGARAGVGGDWYDVIPLSGARVALVIGDVVGRGLYASAAMGRLRTAVRTLADVDLMPDELLTHLDDVVIRMQREQHRDWDETSATCLYAVYDPVSRICSLASAGHVLPAVVPPEDSSAFGGTPRVHFAAAPIGPPLGLGGHPFETAQFELAEGSLLALFTDGLIEGVDLDPGVGLARLRDILMTRADPSLEDACDRLLEGLLPVRPRDDVALLLARTHALDADHVATLDGLPSDPSMVSRARAYASDRLAAWNLDELAFTTELIVSELVTNAIRYGSRPISLRLILQSTLTCEVADAASTSPRLRRARTFDEGGRGLLLVAQLASNWGTRYTRDGKVIWAEQRLPRAS